VARLLIHAPGINVGGGLVLLKELLAVVNIESSWINLDSRAVSLIDLKPMLNYSIVRPSLISRLVGEFRLYLNSTNKDTVLCFNGMPPIFPVKGNVKVFLQNRHLLGHNSLSVFTFKTRIRLTVERYICKIFKFNVSEFIVQTPSMKHAVLEGLCDSINVRIYPFMPLLDLTGDNITLSEKNDFIYVADGEHHKNHNNLLKAWVELALEGIYPSLVLTIPKRNHKLLSKLSIIRKKYNLVIENKSELEYDMVKMHYLNSRSLIYPSTFESFGLPLLEASNFGLPIIASELDFVRDVCTPLHTFDPNSPLSIARAVKRFLGISMATVKIYTAKEFIEELNV